MVINLITKKWMKGIYTRQKINCLRQDIIVHTKYFILSRAMKRSLKNSTIDKVNKHIEFSERFSKSIIQKQFDLLSYIFTLRAFPILQILKMTRYRQIDNHYETISSNMNYSINLITSLVNRVFNNSKYYWKNYNQYKQPKKIDYKVIKDLEKCTILELNHLYKFIKDPQSIPNWFSREKIKANYSNYYILGSVNKISIQKTENIRESQKYSDEAILDRSISFEKNINNENNKTLQTIRNASSRTQWLLNNIMVKLLSKRYENKTYEKKNIQEKMIWNNKIIKVIGGDKYTLLKTLSEQSFGWKNESRIQDQYNTLPARSKIVSLQKNTSKQPQMPFVKTTKENENRNIAKTDSKLKSESFPLINKKASIVSREINYKEIEKKTIKKVVENLEQRINRTVLSQLSLNSNYSHKLSEHILSNLYNRIILEKERIGRF